MGLDLKKSYSDASEEISAIKTVKESSKADKKLKKDKIKDPTSNTKAEKKQITSDEDKKSLGEKIKDLRSSEESPIEKLLLIFTQTDDAEETDDSEDSNENVKEKRKQKKSKKQKRKNRSSLDRMSRIFLTTCVNTKERILKIIIQEILYAIGCSQDQSYGNFALTNTPIYVKIKNIDFFNILKNSPDDELTKYSYEDSATTNGSLFLSGTPYSMNRQLYTRTLSPNSFFQEYGEYYKGASGNEIFDIQYEQINNEQYFKITLKPQANNQDTVTNFLEDYYRSIDLFNLDNLINNILSKLFNTTNFELQIPEEELTVIEKFFSIIKRLMGICTDNPKIEVSGNAKIAEDDSLSDDFFTVSGIELRQIEDRVNNIQNGLVTFDGCDSVLLPINVLAVTKLQKQIISENKSEKKIDNLLNGLAGLSKDPNWSGSIDVLNLNILDFIFREMIIDLPTNLLKTILSPKFMLGFMTMFKAIKTVASNTFNEYYDGLLDFLKKFKKVVFGIAKKIVTIFIEELFKEIKKNIKLLVQDILLDIATEQQKKYYEMYSSIVYSLLQLNQLFTDFANCKNVIDEILKLLNLSVAKLNIGLPQFVLAGAAQLGGVSDTRAFANTIKNLQKAGLPTGANADGSPNLMNIALKGLIQGQNTENNKNGKAEMFIPPLTMTPAGITLPSKGVGKAY
jgi:hypothetical protein